MVQGRRQKAEGRRQRAGERKKGWGAEELRELRS